VKVFCIGAHKTGTTSMESALTMLGLRVCPAHVWWQNPALQTDFYRGEYGPVFDVIERFDAFQDSPFNHSNFYEVLYRAYPDAKFIFTMRDTDNWVGSRKRWRAILIEKFLTTDKQLEQAARLFLEQEYGQSDYRTIDEEADRSVYERRNRRVLDFFTDPARPLLTLDLEQEDRPWQKLCAFLGLPVPDQRFPHANRTK
jgi:sulfotransferase family protein